MSIESSGQVKPEDGLPYPNDELLTTNRPELDDEIHVEWNESSEEKIIEASFFCNCTRLE